MANSSSTTTTPLRYPYPSTINPSSFVSIKLLNAENYSLWEAQMMCLIASQELLGFIDGTILAPPETILISSSGGGGGETAVANDEYRLWKRSDWLVKGWILGSLVDHVLATVVGLPTAQAVWSSLFHNFGPHSQEDEVAEAKPTKTFNDYPDLSMVKVENFISVKLTRSNFSIWRIQLLCLLQSQDVYSFFFRPAPLIKNENNKPWKRLDLLLKGWILGSISEDLLWLVAYSDTSKDVLVTLEDIFITNDRHRIFSRNTNTTKKENQEVATVSAPRQVKTFKDYPYPSTVNVANFVFIKLCRTNYRMWIEQIIRLIKSHKLENFIFSPAPSEVVRSPDDGNLINSKIESMLREDYKLWTRSDLLVKGWILGLIAEDILPLVVHLRTARDVLAKLEDSFLTNEKNRMFSQNPITAEQGHQEAEAVVAARQVKTFKDYPDLSMVNVANFISVKLTKTNYSIWRTQIICLLSSQDLFSFIFSPTPSEFISILNDEKSIKNEAYRLWSRLDFLLKGWILGSITEDILPFVTFSVTSRDALAILEDIFLTNEKHRMFSHDLRTANRAPSEVVSSENGDNSISSERESMLRKDAYKSWRRSDLLLKGWILGSISEDILPFVAYLSTSRDVLAKLEETFLTNDKNSIFSVNTITEEQGHKEGVAVITARLGKTMKDYSHLSTVNVANFISIKLSGTNYSMWVEQVLCLLRSQDLLSFIFTSEPSKVVSSPEDKLIKDQDCNIWESLNLLIKGWILGSITEDLLPLVAYLPTSREVLARLEEKFLKNNMQIFSTATEQAAIARNDVSLYLPLYKAALAGDWETVKEFFDRDGNAATAIITDNHETVLHVAVGNGKANRFVEKLVEHLPDDALNLKTRSGNTALSVAAMVGNTDAVKILMKRNPALLSTRDNDGDSPLFIALNLAQRETATYIQSISSDDDYAGETAVALLTTMILAEYYDLALELVKRYPHAARLQSNKHKPLNVIAGMVSAFPSGMHLNYVESFIYSCVPVTFENYLSLTNRGDIDVENPSFNNSQTLLPERVQRRGVCQRLHLMLWDVIQGLVPPIKSIRDKKLVHQQVAELVKCLCEGVKSSLDKSTYERISEPVTRAASLGVVEVVEEIVDTLPYSIWSKDESGYAIHQIAVACRCEKVFNLIYQMSGYQHCIIPVADDSRNCMLHLAGRLAPPHKLNLVSGAALQMQRELQWFQEVEKFTHPTFRKMKNSSGETPAMVFTREQKELVIEGEKWMKDTANSCTIAAALIITMVFAAAITVPGGNNGDTGLPVFSNGVAFWLFAVSDAISLFTSTTSLLMFLSILTARYAEQDFLHALPKRLVLGLFTLFLSITSMIIAFSTTVYLVFGERNGWIIIPLSALSCLPITSFVTLQFPLLRDVFSSTYGRGIFGKQSDRPFY